MKTTDARKITMLAVESEVGLLLLHEASTLPEGTTPDVILPGRRVGLPERALTTTMQIDCRL
jgi:hypothetical protein